MSDDGSTAVEKKGRGRPKANGTQAVCFFKLINTNSEVNIWNKTISCIISIFRMQKVMLRNEEDHHHQ